MSLTEGYEYRCTIAHAGNTCNPALATLLHHGCTLHLEPVGESPDTGWLGIAEYVGRTFEATDPETLLGLFATWRARGDDIEIKQHEWKVLDELAIPVPLKHRRVFPTTKLAAAASCHDLRFRATRNVWAPAVAATLAGGCTSGFIIENEDGDLYMRWTIEYRRRLFSSCDPLSAFGLFTMWGVRGDDWHLRNHEDDYYSRLMDGETLRPDAPRAVL